MHAGVSGRERIGAVQKGGRLSCGTVALSLPVNLRLSGRRKLVNARQNTEWLQLQERVTINAGLSVILPGSICERYGPPTTNVRIAVI